jgi:hypothetical protein
MIGVRLRLASRAPTDAICALLGRLHADQGSSAAVGDRYILGAGATAPDRRCKVGGGPGVAFSYRCSLLILIAPAEPDGASTSPPGQAGIGIIDRGRMMRAIRRVAILVTIAILATGGGAAADGVYHTERLSFAGGVDPAFHGQVVNIHPNGPVNGALERYQVVGAGPSTEYEVWIQFCEDADFTDFTQTADLTTDLRGNGHASARISAADLAPFSGATVMIRWVLRVDAADVYVTPCTTVTID